MLGDTAVRLWRLYHTPQGKRLFRYTMVSVVSTVVSFSILGVIYGGLRLWSEVPDALIANVCAIVPSYYLNRSWAWGKSGPSHLWREVLPFWCMSVAGIVLSVFAAGYARSLGLSLHLHHFGRTMLLLAANVVAFGVLWVLKFALFNRLFHAGPVPEGDLVNDAAET